MERRAATCMCLFVFLIISRINAQTKIPIDGHRWYQLNNCTNGLQQLFDSNLYEKPNTGWGKILANYDAYYPLEKGEQMTIDSVRLFDWEGIIADHPVTIYAITNTNDSIWIATFKGLHYNGWVGPDPDSPNVFRLATPATNIRTLVLNSWYEYPTEVAFYGSYTPPTPDSSQPLKHPVQLRDFLGVNAFEWNFIHGANPNVIDEAMMPAARSFAGIRHYMDWQKLESQEGSYTFSPCHSGGWNYDTLYKRCQAEGIEVLADLKTIPDWMKNTYPEGDRDQENVPVRYGADFTAPASYIEQARAAFQYAARYGANALVDTALLVVNDTPRWTMDPINKVRIGLNLVHYIECDNERDKWWKGRKAYQTGREYAANLSAFYDGHKGTLGAGVGVKNADSTMQVVMCGIASDKTDYIRGMIDWCKQYRGYKADSAVDLCWDVINYHYYSNDSHGSQSGYPTRGMAPELAGTDSAARRFVAMAHKDAGDMPVWVTEAGYDENQWSPYRAIPIGSKTALQTQADWILRSSLLYAREGVSKLFFYQMYDDNVFSGGQFASSGLIDTDYVRKPAASFMYQVKQQFGTYYYDSTISADPLVDCYHLDTSRMYVLTVPDETGRTESYTLDIAGVDTAIIWYPQTTGDTMSSTKVAVTNGQLSLTVTETPCFVTPYHSGAANKSSSFRSPNSRAEESSSQLKVFPNPVKDVIKIVGLDEDTPTPVALYDLAGRKLLTKQCTGYCTIDATKLSGGIYLVKTSNDTKPQTVRIFKY